MSGRGKDKKRRSGISIMGQLIGLVKPLLPVMLTAIALGIIGYLCAIFLTILAGYGMVHGLLLQMGIGPETAAGSDLGSVILNLPLRALFIILVVSAVARGLLHYGEQYCNHFIAFRLLAIIRHRVFGKLRQLAPAKLEGKDKGDLISLITSDIELLEVFYAHTISPIAIGTITSILMVLFIGSQHPAAGVLALAGYVVVGAVIPLTIGARGGEDGLRYREAFGELNSYVLESMRGIDETIQYGGGTKRLAQITARSAALGKQQKELNQLEKTQRSVTNLTVMVFSFGMLFLMTYLKMQQVVDFKEMLIATIAMMSSFGPVIALSSLANNLNQTLASGERVLSLLEEMPEVEENDEGVYVDFDGAAAKHVTFSYDEETILSDYSLEIPKGQVIGIHGASGSGKSTLLKLLMRFWDADRGTIEISGRDVRDINTGSLRENQSYVTQEVCLFHDSIAANIAIGSPGASPGEIEEAARRASIHEFIMSLPEGYDTQVGELGETLSGGERQRIGIARAFLHDAPFLLLDEPTSNLDALNEGVILKSLYETREDKTIVLVSHKLSTLNFADRVENMQEDRVS